MKLDWDTFKFATRHKSRISTKNVGCCFNIPLATFERIRRLAEKRGCGMSKALLELINTAQAEAIEPTPVIKTGKNRLDLQRKYAVYSVTNILQRKTHRK